MKAYVGRIDQGTEDTRFIVFDADGRMVSVAQKEHQQIYSQPGWVEHDPAEIIRNTNEVAAQALRSAGIGAGELAAVGITNQRETTVIWDKKRARRLPMRLSGKTHAWRMRSPDTLRMADRIVFPYATGFSAEYLLQ